MAKSVLTVCIKLQELIRDIYLPACKNNLANFEL